MVAQIHPVRTESNLIIEYSFEYFDAFNEKEAEKMIKEYVKKLGYDEIKEIKHSKIIKVNAAIEPYKKVIYYVKAIRYDRMH